MGRDALRLRIDSVISELKPQVDPNLWKIEFIPVKFTPAQLPLVKYPNIYYVIKVTTKRGRAHVYQTGKGDAYIRMSGSTRKMLPSLIEERIRMGRPALPPPLSISLSPKLVHEFIGRSEELRQIYTYVAQETEAEAPIIITVLHGLPLVGKSALAMCLAEDLRKDFPDNFYVINMKGEGAPYITLTEAMASVVLQKHPQIKLPKNEAQLRGLYESCFANSKTLMVIENAGPTTRAILDTFPRTSKHTMIIITSRKEHRLDLERKVLSVRLNELKLEDAATLLIELAGSVEWDDAITLAKLCGCMPLPLKMIASTIKKQPNLTPKSMIRRLGREQARIALVERQLLAVLEESPEEIKEHLMAVSLFPHSFDGAAAASLFSEDYDEAEDSLGLLLEDCLIEFNREVGLYMLHDLVRLYVYNLTKSLPEKRKNLLERYVNHYMNFLEFTTSIVDCDCDSTEYGAGSMENFGSSGNTLGSKPTCGSTLSLSPSVESSLALHHLPELKSASTALEAISREKLNICTCIQYLRELKNDSLSASFQIQLDRGMARSSVLANFVSSTSNTSLSPRFKDKTDGYPSKSPRGPILPSAIYETQKKVGAAPTQHTQTRVGEEKEESEIVVPPIIVEVSDSASTQTSSNFHQRSAGSDSNQAARNPTAPLQPKAEVSQTFVHPKSKGSDSTQAAPNSTTPVQPQVEDSTHTSTTCVQPESAGSDSTQTASTSIQETTTPTEKVEVASTQNTATASSTQNTATESVQDTNNPVDTAHVSTHTNSTQQEEESKEDAEAKQKKEKQALKKQKQRAKKQKQRRESAGAQPYELRARAASVDSDKNKHTENIPQSKLAQVHGITTEEVQAFIEEAHRHMSKSWESEDEYYDEDSETEEEEENK
eukprot:TRINITY_DN7316_c0_g1_i2.p1 TRINITY_DN7316_c0_g1~~TRINITY_DN7316_c0_g1_i2.p1  ORF type:complete len:1039 (-),score=228.48 TRINITY_DN7316_c0_g1_i2:28-2688(-)